MNERFKAPSENKTIYIKNIPKRIKSIEEIKKIFGKFGKIIWGEIYQDSVDRHYAILEFDTPEMAIKAKEEMGDKKLDEKDESGLYVDFHQKRSERKRMLTSKIGDINNKLNQEYKNCNLYVKNLPFENIETSYGFGFVCYTNAEDAKKAIDEFNGKYLPGYENIKRPPIYITYFMPKNERKQQLNKEASQSLNQTPFVPTNYLMYPPNIFYNRNIPYGPRMYRRPQQPRQNQNQNQNNQVNNQHMQTNVVNNNLNGNNNNDSSLGKEDEPSLEILQSLDTLDKQKDYLGEFLFKKIEQHPITQRKNLDMDTIGKITGMILGIDNIKEIYDITTNNDYIESRINEALKLLNKR